MARLGKVTGISSVLVAAAASAPELQSNNTVPSISPCCTALQNIIARVGGFNGISKPAVGRRCRFIRNHEIHIRPLLGSLPVIVSALPIAALVLNS